VAKDASCDVSTNPDNIKNVCDPGLYCDFELLTMSGSCQTAKMLGEMCSPGALELSCGLGAYCDSTTSVCTVAKDEGAACNGILECKSLNCTMNVCVKPEPLFAGAECTGMP
jgi:hypothetical protein